MIRSALAITAGLLFASAAAAAPVQNTDKPAAPVVMTEGQLDTVVAGEAPANPGQFGQDRAAYASAHPGGPTVVGSTSYYVTQRAGDNGALNQAYMISVGSLPAGVSPGQVP
jgi:hypothetical protein